MRLEPPGRKVRKDSSDSSEQSPKEKDTPFLLPEFRHFTAQSQVWVPWTKERRQMWSHSFAVDLGLVQQLSVTLSRWG
jgi:hypothetical protein